MMNYTKPEVAVLGEAVRIISQRTLKSNTAIIEAIGVPRLNPSYDLDE
jgi:hypothetical protein